MSQFWTLSQEANKATGVCSVCRATRQLHHKDGTVHKHGPRDKPCPGSHKPPLTTVKGTDSASQLSRASSDTSIPPAVSTRTAKSADSTASVPWRPTGCGVIKHIPKSARSSCAAHLAKLLRAATEHPEQECNWIAIFN